MNAKIGPLSIPPILPLLVVFLAGCSSDDADAEPEAGDVPAEVGSDAVDADAVDAPDAADPTDAAFEPPYDWCDDAPPDAECFAARRDPESASIELAVEIADRILAEHEVTGLRWDWGEAVMMLGVVQVARVTGDERYWDYVASYVDHHVSDGVGIQTSDTSAPTALCVELIAAGRDEERYRAVVDQALDYYADEAARSPEGGISHFGTVALFGAELWADSLFMFGNVMTGWGEVADDAELLDDYAAQYEIFSDLMQEGDGFFRHAEYTAFPQDPDVYWARANGWIHAAGYDHLSVRIDRGEDAPEVREAAGWLTEAVLASQDPDTGLWWTVLNRPGETYLETSASALFAFAMARGWRYGLLGDEVLPAIESAMEGVVARIERDEERRPVVTGISGPTNVGGFDNYASVPLGDDISYGLGAVLYALTETSGLPDPAP